MSAELLRESATLMRERAEAATEGPWVIGEITGPYPQERIPAYTDIEPMVAGGIDVPDALHIASWHPAVALAVADWLDSTAAGADEMVAILRECGERSELNWQGGGLAPALTVARAYLGSES